VLQVRTHQGDGLSFTPALALPSRRNVKVGASLTLARIGDDSPVGALPEELEKNYPSDTLLNLYRLPTISAAIHPYAPAIPPKRLLMWKRPLLSSRVNQKCSLASGIPRTCASKTCGHETELLQPRSSRYC
jgi:hypothetical protein